MRDFQQIVDEWVWANKIHLSGGHPKGIHPSARADLIERLELNARGRSEGFVPRGTEIIDDVKSIAPETPVMGSGAPQSTKKPRKAKV